MKKLSLKKETLTRLDSDELAEVVAGTATFTCGCTGYSCASVCVESVYCPTYTCPDAAAILTKLEGALPGTIG